MTVPPTSTAPIPAADELPAPYAPGAVGDAVRRAELGLAATLAGSWLGAAFAWGAAHPAVGVLLGISAGLAAARRLPRTQTAAGAAAFLAGTIAWGEGAGALLAALLEVGAAATRLSLRWGETGAWLAGVEDVTRRRTRWLLAMELARARARRAGDPAGRARWLERAGDHYEAAGRLRLELAGRGAPGAGGERIARTAGAVLGAALARVPTAADRLEAWLVARAGGAAAGP